MEGMIFMRTSLKRLSIFVIVMMFFAVMSGGCGGGGSGGGDSNNVSQENRNNSGWDTDPDEQNQNNNGNNNQNDNNNNNGNGDNQNDNNNDNGNDNHNNNNGSPVAINGTWEIVSGHAVVSDDKSNLSLTYKPGRIGEIGIEMRSNGNTYGPAYSGMYTLMLTGNNVIGTNGIGSLLVDYSYDDYPDRTAPLIFSSFPSFKYIGNGTYEMTEENTMNSGISARFTVTLENSSTLHLYYRTVIDSAHVGFGTLNHSGWWDIYLRKVR